MTTQQGLQLIKDYYILYNAVEKVGFDRVLQRKQETEKILKDNFTIEELQKLNAQAEEYTLAKRNQLQRNVNNSQRARFLKNQFSRVEYLGGGWYRFSPNGHKYYNRHADITIHGYDNLIEALKECDRFSLAAKGYQGTIEYVGTLPE